MRNHQYQSIALAAAEMNLSEGREGGLAAIFALTKMAHECKEAAPDLIRA